MADRDQFKKFVETYFHVPKLSAEASSGIGAANFRNIEGSLDPDTIAAILKNKSFYKELISEGTLKIGAYVGSFQGKSSHEITYILNAVSPIDLSLSVPVLRVAFIPVQPISEVKVARANVANIVSMNNPDEVAKLARKDYVRQGYEIYLYPQHLWTKEKNSSLSGDNRAIKPFLPLWAINNATIEVSESDYGPIFYERVSLSMILHDVSRLPEIIPLINPDFHTTVAIEFGWDSSLSERQGMGHHVFKMKRKIMCRVVNYDISITGDRKAEINLTLMTDGYDMVRKISLSNAYLKVKLKKFKKAIEALEKKVGNSFEKTTDASYKKSLRRIGEFVEEVDESKLKKPQKNRADVKNVLEITNSISKEISNKLKLMFDIEANKKVLDAAQEMFDKSNEASEGKKQVWTNLKESFVDGKFTTLATIMKILLKDLANASDVKKDTFVFFGNANKFAAALGGRSFGAYIINQDKFSEALKRHLVANRSVDLTFNDIISTVQADMNDLKNDNYGLAGIFNKWQLKKNNLSAEDLPNWQRNKLDDKLVSVGSFNKIENDNGVEEPSAMFIVPNIRYEVISNETQQAIIVYDSIDMNDIINQIDDLTNKNILDSVYNTGVDAAGKKTGLKKANFKKLKKALRHSVPYAIIGSERTGISDFTMSTVGDDELETIYIVNSGKLNDAGSGKDWVTNLNNMNSPDQYMPFSFFPLESEMTTIGMPFISYNQKIFIDLNTNTNVDSIYNVVGVSHELAPGNFSTKLTLKPMGGYAYYSTQLDKLKE